VCAARRKFKTSFLRALETEPEWLPIIGQGEAQGHTHQEIKVTKRRRIEISILRSRTTIIRHEGLEKRVPELPHHDPGLPLHIEPAQLVEAELVDNPAAQQSATDQSVLERDRQDPKLTPDIEKAIRVALTEFSRPND
jgi:hypothetical protein